MNIRPSPIAGTWYPDNPERLKRTISDFMSQVDTAVPPGKIWGLVVPHAGHRYSGQVAAHGFNCLQGLQPDLVVIISPLHALNFVSRAPLFTTAHDAYETPLGLVPVDQTAVTQIRQALRQHAGTAATPITQDTEHAIEIELPFLQHVLGPFNLLPIMMRDQSKQMAHGLGRALAEVLHGRNAIIIASSDLSHFKPQSTANQLDNEVLRRVEAFDPEGVIDAEAEGVGYACGRGAIAATLWAAQALGANQVNILNYATSGDVTGDFRSVVGYGTAVIWQK